MHLCQFEPISALHTWSFNFIILYFICRITATHRGLSLLLSTWRNGSVRYIFCAECWDIWQIVQHLSIFLKDLCTTKCHSAFSIVAQLPATKKLQGERSLQAVYTGRYVWTVGLWFPISSVTLLCKLNFALTDHYFMFLQESWRMRMASQRMKKTLRKP